MAVVSQLLLKTSRSLTVCSHGFPHGPRAVARLAGASQIAPYQPQIRSLANANDVVHLGRHLLRNRPRSAVRPKFAQRVSLQFQGPQPLPGAIIAPFARATAARVVLAIALLLMFWTARHSAHEFRATGRSAGMFG